ncbi:MAG: DEAD/DEAH box helicase [Actinomycetaceae bacterium]|nr:DEAD/DEAH box helicase [Actinomycetaceae bacterium]
MVRRKRRRSSPPLAVSSDEQLSPSQAYQQFKRQQHYERSLTGQFEQSCGFSFDSFQRDACRALEDDMSVLVAAPTGAGKTVVGEFGVFLARHNHQRAFYTTPIKALSNQKYHDLCDRWGEEHVGLLTGDNSIRPDAPIIVMTTEVLRNMIYADPSRLDGLSHVILDEVHYLADKFRGPVWEEIIIHLPERINVICLSATVSNAEEFGAWLREVRGQCAIIVCEQRPVPLQQHMIVKGKFFDLYSLGKKKKINPELQAWVDGLSRPRYDYSPRRSQQSARGSSASTSTRRSDVVKQLRRRDLLPAIVFIFSRLRCDEAVDMLLNDKVVLTTPQQRKEIRDYVDPLLTAIPHQDWQVLGISRWIQALEAGIAAHHAGMLPLQKEIVEALFVRGLIQVVYATETLSLGINMPARSVVLESLRKFDGSEHVQLSPGQYTQLTGRAGRRGIDKEGHAIVVYQRRQEPTVISSLASKRSYPLYSAFRPTYNMVTNLLRDLNRDNARHILERSFAQYQADSQVVTLARKADRLQKKLREERTHMKCSQGDINDYFQLLTDRDKQRNRSYHEARAQANQRLNHIFQSLRPGDVICYRIKGKQHYEVVVEPLMHNYVTFVSQHARIHDRISDECGEHINVVGHIELHGRHFRKPRERAKISSDLRHFVRNIVYDAPFVADDSMGELALLEEKIRNHPCASCPDLAHHMGASRAWRRQKRKLDAILSDITIHTSTLGHQFDTICTVLEKYGCITRKGVSEFGTMLTRIYSERDLFIALCLERGVWKNLTPEHLAGAVAVAVCDDKEYHSPVPLPGPLDTALSQMVMIYADLAATETQAHAEPTAVPAWDLAVPVWLWAQGCELKEVLDLSGLSVGDFVRILHLIIDMLTQLQHVGNAQLSTTCVSALKLLRKGVVAWSHT